MGSIMVKWAFKILGEFWEKHLFWHNHQKKKKKGTWIFEYPEKDIFWNNQ